MKIKEIFGKEITRVFCVFGMHDGWLDTGDCILELDGNLLIGFPFSVYHDIRVRELPENAQRLFRQGYDRDVIGCKILDFIWYEDELDPAYFLLDNGAVITETRMSPRGTGTSLRCMAKVSKA
jgi:hypothetical protein